MTTINEKEISSPDIEAYQAMKLLESGDTALAVQRCIGAIERFGDSRNCYLVKARAHIEQEEYGFAEDALQNVLRLDPEHPAAWAMLGEVYFRLGRETKVEYCRRRLEDIFPVLTESTDGDDNISEIEDDLHKITETDGGDNPSLNGQSIVPLEDIDSNPEKPKTSESSSDIEEQSDFELSSEVEGETLETARDTGGLKSELFETATFADICMSQGKYEKALSIYSRLLGDDPDNQLYKDRIKQINQVKDDSSN